jgi:hypothetical protein
MPLPGVSNRGAQRAPLASALYYNAQLARAETALKRLTLLISCCTKARYLHQRLLRVCR